MFGFPLGSCIRDNAIDNHQSALAFPEVLP